MVLADRSYASNPTCPSPLHFARDRTAFTDVIDRTFWEILAGCDHDALRTRLSYGTEGSTSRLDELDNLGDWPDAAFRAALLHFAEKLAWTQNADMQRRVSFHEQSASTTLASANAAEHDDLSWLLLASTALGHFEHFFIRFFKEHPDIAGVALEDGPEALDQEIFHWIAETGVCGTNINEFWHAFNDPASCALSCYINMRIRGQ